MKMSRVLLVSLAFFLVFSSAASASTIEEATVNLYCKMKLGNVTYSTTGSGVFISEKGVILTNAHVAQHFLLATSTTKAKANCKVRTGSPAKDTYNAEVLYLPVPWITTQIQSIKGKTDGKGSGDRDYALLYVTSGKSKKTKLPEHFPALPLLPALSVPQLSEGEKVTIAGYPAENLSYKDVQKKLKFVSDLSSIESIRSLERPYADVLALAPSTIAQSGVSGGPIVTNGGYVAGIASTMGETKSKGIRSLRAITTAHFEHTMKSDTGLTLLDLYAGDLATRAKLTEAALPKTIRKSLETSLRRMQTN